MNALTLGQWMKRPGGAVNAPGPADLEGIDMTDSTEWHINPDTFALEGGKDRTFTEEEWDAQQWPPCPVCGTTIDVDRADVRRLGDRDPVYVMGEWGCPNSCAIGPARAWRGGLRAECLERP